MLKLELACRFSQKKRDKSANLFIVQLDMKPLGVNQ